MPSPKQLFVLLQIKKKLSKKLLEAIKRLLLQRNERTKSGVIIVMTEEENSLFLLRGLPEQKIGGRKREDGQSLFLSGCWFVNILFFKKKESNTAS